MFAQASDAINGPINNNDSAELLPSLETTSVPTGAVAVGYNIKKETTSYYRVNGGTLANNTITMPGWFPDQANSSSGEENISPNEYIGTDDRVAITNTTQMPYSAIARIEVSFPSGSSTATAYMISDNVAITAAHAVFLQETTSGGSYEWPEKVKVFPGQKSSNIFTGYPYGNAKAIEVVISAPFFTEKATLDSSGNRISTRTSSYYDWALLYLDDEIGAETGYFGYQFTNGTTGMNVSITGYKDGVPPQYKASGTVISAPTNIAGAELLNQEYIMLYMIDAGDGQSGSPIYYQSSDGSWISIGIHTADYTYADGTGQLNQGNRFTSQLFSFVLAYTSSH